MDTDMTKITACFAIFGKLPESPNTIAETGQIYEHGTY